MAHPVKCPICGEKFDRDKEPYAPYKGRYAHQRCYPEGEIHEPEGARKEKKTKVPSYIPKEDMDEYKLTMDYIQSLFGADTNWAMVQKQLQNYIENGYKYSGVRASLKYFYEIQHGDKTKANNAIGIVPYVYDRARSYYQSIRIAKANAAKHEVRKIEEITVEVAPKQRRGWQRQEESILDEE